MPIQIEATAFYLPQNVCTNQELADTFGRWSPKKILQKTGIESRHVTGPDETALDLAEHACRKLFATTDGNGIDYVLFCTQSPEYYLPSTACLLQERLGLDKTIGALDFNLGCSGFVGGLALAKGLIAGGMAKRVLLITSETYTKHIHPQDLANRTIFGDAAAASIITSCDEEQIGAFAFGTDGSGAGNLIVRNGGLRHRYDPNAPDIEDDSGNIHTDNNLYMNGPEIFNFTIEAVPVLVSQVLTNNNIEIDDLDFVIFHQANKFILEYLRKVVKIPKDKFHIDMTNTGNTVSATIPIALHQCISQGRIKQNDRVMLIGFGVGYSWAGVVTRISQSLVESVLSGQET